MPAEFIPIDRDTPQLFPPSVEDYLPEKHLARFVVQIVDQLDLKHLVAAYRGTGSTACHPEMLVALLFYGYATGVFSSRKLAQATYESIAFRFICANAHPDQRTIADFRKRFLAELQALFVEILLVAQAMGLVKLGTVSLEGTKIKANASKHKALSWEHANRIEVQLKGEVAALLADTSYHSEANIERCQAAGIEALIPDKRDRHNRPLAERFAEDPAPPETRSRRGHGASPAHRGGQGTLGQAQIDGGDRLRHHQARAGFPPVAAAWPACRARGVGAGLYRMESEAPFCLEWVKNGSKSRVSRKNDRVTANFRNDSFFLLSGPIATHASVAQVGRAP